LKYFARIMLIGGGIGLIIIAALKFVLISSSGVDGAILGIFYLLFGIITGMMQLGFQAINR
jgi:hypothetical protein